MKIREKIVKETTVYVTEEEKEGFIDLVKYCDGTVCTNCRFSEVCEEGITLAERIRRFFEIADTEGENVLP